jgi:predicted RNA binding protein YcfA (HicA-like mRNA interferase family)
MSKFEKLIIKLLSGSSDKNFDFDDLVKVVLSLGFILKKVNGSHHVFYKDGLQEIINLQPKDGKAKPYQVKQVREIIVKYKLWKDGTE